MKAHIKERALEHVEQLLADERIDEERASEMRERIEDGDFRGKGPGHKGHRFHVQGYGAGPKIQQ